MSYNFDPSILREYDIRGIVGETLTEDDAYAVGRSFATIIAKRNGSKVGVCYDGRHSSPGLSNALIKGLTEGGMTVENYGVGPTPLSYYALENRDLDGAIAITGSHNPPEYNGIKLSLKGEAVYGDRIQEIGRLAANDGWITGEGEATEINIYEDYTDRLAQDCTLPADSTMKVAWDAGNGAAGAVLKMLTDKLPGEHILLFEDVDGDFPNHHPDPQVEANLEDLKRVVKEHGCDLGVAFDGDGDRAGVIDHNCEMIAGDQLIALYAKEVAKTIDNPMVIFDVKCSQAVIQKSKEWNCNPIIWKTGHSLIKAKLKETQAPIGGELSGHIYFNDHFYGHDDGLYCAVRIMNIVHKDGALSEIKKAFPPSYATPEIRFDVPEERKFQIIEDIKSILNADSSGTYSVLDVDGARVTTVDGWFLIRASNTQNALSLRLEGVNENSLFNLKSELSSLLKKTNTDIPQALKA